MDYTAHQIAAEVDAQAAQQWEDRCAREEADADLADELAECIEDAKDQRMGTPAIVGALLETLGLAGDPVPYRVVQRLADTGDTPTVQQALAVIGLSHDPMAIWGALQVLREAMLRADADEVANLAHDMAKARGLLEHADPDWPTNADLGIKGEG